MGRREGRKGGDKKMEKEKLEESVRNKNWTKKNEDEN